jgi:predicted transcriptional regulator
VFGLPLGARGAGVRLSASFYVVAGTVKRFLNEIVRYEKENIMAIGEMCNREVVIVERETSLGEAARLMRQHHVGDLVVVESLAGGRRPLGIVTDRDIVLEVVAMDIAPESLRVGDIMSARLVSVRESEGVFETIRYMRSQGIRRVPVVDEAGWLVGIITLDDLLELLAEEIGELAKLVIRERGREQEARK